jgi:hypothetical protein
MNNTLHTPAPWQVSPYGNITSKSGKIASVEQMPGNYESEKQANACLISAAPDLLSALIELERVESSPHSETVRYLARENAREAIRKAGREA